MKGDHSTSEQCLLDTLPEMWETGPTGTSLEENADQKEKAKLLFLRNMSRL